MSHRLFIPFQPAATDRDFASLPPSLLTSLVSLNCPCQGQESGIQMMSRGRRREQDTDSHHPHWFQYRHHTLSPYTAKYILSTNRSRTQRLKCKLPSGCGHSPGSHSRLQLFGTSRASAARAKGRVCYLNLAKTKS